MFLLLFFACVPYRALELKTLTSLVSTMAPDRGAAAP